LKILYIYHSCFIVETKSSFLMFDYFKNNKNSDSDFNFYEVLNEILYSSKPLYVFASHSHHDHFNSEILAWSIKKKELYYILSFDIKIHNNVNNLYIANKNEKFTLNNLKINTFGSTDEGISFLLNIDDHNIFHAGDLNWWKWMDDTKEEEKAMEDAYKNVVNDISKTKTSIDVAFFPVDKRLEENYLYGGEYFIEKLKPKIFIPMHFGDNFKTTKDFKNSQSKHNVSTNIIEINHSNEILYNIMSL